MAKFLYVCECGVQIDGKKAEAIAEHEASCPVASASSALDEVRDMVQFFTNTNDLDRVDTVSKLLLQLDSDVKEFYEESDSDGSLASVTAVKLLDFMVVMERRLSVIESKLKIAKEPNLEPQGVRLELKEMEDSKLSETLYRVSQDTNSVDEETDI